jgi:cytochrome b561
MEERSIQRFGSITQTLHWLTAIFVLVAFTYGLGGSEQRVYLPARDLDRQIHETLGLCVFALLILRIVWKMFDKRPQPEDLPRWMEIAGKLLQGVLYLLLFAVPASAIAGAWLEGHPLTLLGRVEIAPMLGLSHDLGVTISELHTLLGDAILWLAGMHAAAAIFHHLVRKDGVLLSLLPRWFPLGPKER